MRDKVSKWTVYENGIHAFNGINTFIMSKSKQMHTRILLKWCDAVYV